MPVEDEVDRIFRAGNAHPDRQVFLLNPRDLIRLIESGRLDDVCRGVGAVPTFVVQEGQASIMSRNAVPPHDRVYYGNTLRPSVTTQVTLVGAGGAGGAPGGVTLGTGGNGQSGMIIIEAHGETPPPKTLWDFLEDED